MAIYPVRAASHTSQGRGDSRLTLEIHYRAGFQDEAGQFTVEKGANLAGYIQQGI